MHLEKLFNEILIQLKEESIKYKKLKICKYSFEISKVCYFIFSNRIIIFKYFCNSIYNINTSYRHN